MDEKEYKEMWDEIMGMVETEKANTFFPMPLEILRGDDYIEVSEESIRFNIVSRMGGFANERDMELLSESVNNASIIKNAGLTPKYYLDEMSQAIYVTSKEYYEGKLH